MTEEKHYKNSSGQASCNRSHFHHHSLTIGRSAKKVCINISSPPPKVERHPSPDPTQAEYMSTNKMSPPSGKEAVPAGGLAQPPQQPPQQHLPVPVPESLRGAVQPAAAKASSSAPAIASTTSMAVPAPIPIPAVSAGLASDMKVPPPPATTTGPPTAAAAAAAPRPSPPSANTAAAKAGTKRSAPITSLPPLDRSGRNLSEKKIRRLEKNRLSARECRRKKKEAAQNMEREINLLEAENLRLRLQLQIGDEAEASSWEEQGKLTEGLDQLLKSGAKESEIYASIEQFKEKHADYGRDRRSAMEFHLRQVERLLMPTTTTSVAMRALHGGADVGAVGGDEATLAPTSFLRPAVEGGGATEAQKSDEAELKMPASRATATEAESRKPKDIGSTVGESTTTGAEGTSMAEVPSVADTDLSSVEGNSPSQTASSDPPSLEPKSMFHYLVKYLEVTPEQAKALKDSRLIAQELDSALTESLSVLEELRLRLTQAGEDLEAEMDSVRAILTPTQAAKFLVWVSNNSACMHMLNELWNQSMPETPQSSES